MSVEVETHRLLDIYCVVDARFGSERQVGHIEAAILSLDKLSLIAI